MAQVNRRRMVELIRIAAAQDKQVVRHVAKIGIEVRDEQTALTARPELPRTAAQDRLRRIVNEARFDDLRQFGRERLARILRQLGFRIERVHVADAAVHVEINYALRFRG